MNNKYLYLLLLFTLSCGSEEELDIPPEKECCECLINNHCTFSEQDVCEEILADGGDMPTFSPCTDFLCKEQCSWVLWGPIRLPGG